MSGQELSRRLPSTSRQGHRARPEVENPLQRRTLSVGYVSGAAAADKETIHSRGFGKTWPTRQSCHCGASRRGSSVHGCPTDPYRPSRTTRTRSTLRLGGLATRRAMRPSQRLWHLHRQVSAVQAEAYDAQVRSVLHHEEGRRRRWQRRWQRQRRRRRRWQRRLQRRRGWRQLGLLWRGWQRWRWRWWERRRWQRRRRGRARGTEGVIFASLSMSHLPTKSPRPPLPPIACGGPKRRVSSGTFGRRRAL